MARKTFNDYSPLFFRQEKLRRLLEDGTSLLMGHDTPLAPYLEEDGLLSLEKTRAFINRLLTSLNVYLFYARRSEMYDPESGEPFDDYYEMPKTELRYYSGFLYALLIETYINNAGKVSPARLTFGSLIKRAADTPHFDSYADMLRRRYLDPDEYLVTGGYETKADYYLGRKGDVYRELFTFYESALGKLKTAGLTDGAGRLLDSEPLPYLATQKQWDAMLKTVTAQESEARQKEIEDEEAWIAESSEAFEDDDYHETASREELDTFYRQIGYSDYEDYLESKRLSEEKAKAASERFLSLLQVIDLEEYRRYLKSCFLNVDCLYDEAHHIDAISGMINVFLADEGLSAISDAESFYPVFVRLESAFDRAKESKARPKSARRRDEK